MTIQEYIQQAPLEQQAHLKEIYQIIKAELPAATEKISYGMPTFYQTENLLHFAGMKKHLGFYPAPSAIQQFQEQLAPYKTSKGAVQFPYTKPLPQKLIQAMVIFRLQEINRK